MTRKICTKCEKEKDIEEFSWRNKSKGRRNSWCRHCRSKYVKQWHQNNPEYNSKYYINNSEQKKEHSLKKKNML